jgi:predicted Zn-ribbon and HTH transcriptional regulator
MSKYVLKSVKAIEFYNKNPNVDFNTVNELFIDLMTKIVSSTQTTISINEVKTLLNSINRKVDSLEHNMEQSSKYMELTYQNMNTQKDFYVEKIKEILSSKDNDSNILTLIRETNQTLIDKTIYSILQQFPKLNDSMTKELKQILHVQQREILTETQKSFEPILSQNIDKNPEQLQHLIQQNYTTISDKIQNIFSPDSLFYQNNLELKNFLEKQKNSTLKGKESEKKLEQCLVSAFPHGNIVDKSGESKACDYLLQRQDKSDILFENKDYANNVPNEEIKKFIRDVEYQKCHGILVSQHSGVNNKQDYQIDIHDGNIIVFIHFANYDESKLRIGVNLIDHLDNILKKHKHMNEDAHISMEQLSEINKEYLTFIGQKKQLIENYKKLHKDHLKQLEDFEMPHLTQILNSKFTNVEQLTYKCKICGYNAKNKRALTSHQNKCKKQNSVVDLENNTTH